MTKINYKRFVNEIEKSDERIENFVIQLKSAFIDYTDAMLEELTDADDESAYFSIIATYSTIGNSGYRGIRAITKRLYKLYEEELADLRPRFGVTEEDADLTYNIAQLQQKKIGNDLASLINRIGTALSIAKSVSNSRIPRKEIREDYIEPEINNTETELVTNVSGYRSSMEIKKSKEIDTNPQFAYIGPRDNRNRPLCRYILDHQQLWTEKQIKELDKHPDAQVSPVAVYGGGYNCRHRWIYVGRQ